jgi:glyoxylase-like metal-dependent hydrolase (beta-lactamase superfamily II)
VLFRQLFDTTSSSYTYLIADETTNHAAIIDPIREQLDRDLALIEELGVRLVYAIETHVHADHVTGGGMLRERIGCRHVTGARGGPSCADVHVSDGDTIELGGISLGVIETPGHTAGCVSLLVDGRVFTGDALMVRTCGRTDFQGGDPGTLHDSIHGKLFTLPDDTLVYPAHDYKGFTVTTIGEEKRFNARLAHRSREDFIQLMNGLNLPMPIRLAEALPANMQCGCPDGAGRGA